MVATKITINANSNTEVDIIEEFNDLHAKNFFIINLAQYFIEKYEPAQIFISKYDIKKEEE